MSLPSHPAPNSTVILQQPSDWDRFVSRLGWRLFLLTGAALSIALLALLIIAVGSADYYENTGDITEKYVSGKKTGQDKVAILSIEGVIMQGQGFVKHQIDRIKQDEDVKAVVVRVDSPGGTVTGSDYIYHHLTQLREEKNIPVVVSMGSIAASGGYYVSMAVGDQENSIFAEPTTTTGSIGVIIPHYNVSALMKEYGLEDDSIASHPRKQMLSMTREMPAEHREIIQGYVNEAFNRFKDIVKSGRPEFRKDPSKLDALATGEIFSATRAKEGGLVDEIGFLEDAIDRAMELASLSKDSTRVVKYNRPPALFDFGDVGSAEAARSELSALFELSTPKAYYLSSTLPAIFSSRKAD